MDLAEYPWTAGPVAGLPRLAVMVLYFRYPCWTGLPLVLSLPPRLPTWFDGYRARSWKQETRMGASWTR